MTEESPEATSERTRERRLVENQVFFRQANELLPCAPGGLSELWTRRLEFGPDLPATHAAGSDRRVPSSLAGM